MCVYIYKTWVPSCTFYYFYQVYFKWLWQMLKESNFEEKTLVGPMVNLVLFWFLSRIEYKLCTLMHNPQSRCDILVTSWYFISEFETNGMSLYKLDIGDLTLWGMLMDLVVMSTPKSPRSLACMYIYTQKYIDHKPHLELTYKI